MVSLAYWVFLAPNYILLVVTTRLSAYIVITTTTLGAKIDPGCEALSHMSKGSIH